MADGSVPGFSVVCGVVDSVLPMSVSMSSSSPPLIFLKCTTQPLQDVEPLCIHLYMQIYKRY